MIQDTLQSWHWLSHTLQVEYLDRDKSPGEPIVINGTMGPLEMAENKRAPTSGAITLLITSRGPLNLSVSYINLYTGSVVELRGMPQKNTSSNHHETFHTKHVSGSPKLFLKKKHSILGSCCTKTHLAVGHDEIWQSIRILPVHRCAPLKKKTMGWKKLGNCWGTLTETTSNKLHLKIKV